MRERDKRSDSGSETDAPSSSSSPSSSSPSPSPSNSTEGSPWESNSARKHGNGKRKRSVPTSRVKDDSEPSSSSSESSDADIKRRKSRSTRRKEKRSTSHRRGRAGKEKEKKRERKRRSSKGSDEKHGRKEKHRRKEKHDRERRKRKVSDVEPVAAVKEDVPAVQFGAKSTLQAVNEAQLQQKEIVRRSVEMAQARLASGELQRMKHDQMEMQRLYGTVDWREKKKLRAEKSRLERTIAAGKKLASIEERENARMDAFRVALGLPTAEAQRQAEWRAEATRALAEAEALNKDNVSPPVSRVPSRSRKVIGPRLPH